MSSEPDRGSLGGALGWIRPLGGLLATGIALYLLIPVAIVFPMALTKQAFLTWPPDLFSIQWFNAFFDSAVWTSPLWQSLQVSVPVCVFATTLGTLAAFGVAHARRRYRRALRTLFIVPLILPIVTYALGLYELSARFGMTGSTWPVVAGQTMLATPLVYVTVSTGLASRDATLPKAAASLGARGLTILWRVELPLQRSSIAAGSLIALAYSFDEIIVAYFLLPPGMETLPVQILAATRETADPIVAAASVVVIGFAATFGALILLVRLLLNRRAA